MGIFQAVRGTGCIKDRLLLLDPHASFSKLLETRILPILSSPKEIRRLYHFLSLETYHWFSQVSREEATWKRKPKDSGSNSSNRMSHHSMISLQVSPLGRHKVCVPNPFVLRKRLFNVTELHKQTGGSIVPSLNSRWWWGNQTSEASGQSEEQPHVQMDLPDPLERKKDEKYQNENYKARIEGQNFV